MYRESSDYTLTKMERHLQTPEACIPLGKDLIFAVAPSRDLTDSQETPRPEDIEAFDLKKGLNVILNKGVWHYAPFTTRDDEEASALVFFRTGTPVADTVFAEISNGKTVLLVT